MGLKASTNLSSLATEIHTQILEYLDNFIDQINAGLALPLWNNILHHSSLYHYSPYLRRSRYVRFQSAWQNAVAIHCAIGGTSGNHQLAVCCAVRNGEIERCSLAWKPVYPFGAFINLQSGGILESMQDMDYSWTEIDLADHFIMNDHFILPFRGKIARGLELPGEDVSISKSHIDSDLRTSFVRVQFKSPSPHYIDRYIGVDEISVFPSHPEDITFRSFLQFIVRKADQAFETLPWGDSVDINELHYLKICADDDLSVKLYRPDWKPDPSKLKGISSPAPVPEPLGTSGLVDQPPPTWSTQEEPPRPKGWLPKVKTRIRQSTILGRLFPSKF